VILRGSDQRLGATWDGDGVNFALFSEHAEAVELCLFDSQGNETARLRLPDRTGDVWHGFVPGCKPGQRYGYRVYGRYDPVSGFRFNPSKLLVDPYARALGGALRWRPEVFGFDSSRPADLSLKNTADSAPFVPKSVVVGTSPKPRPGVRVPWAETTIYETHVRGFTMRHAAVPDADRGTFRGMRNREVLSYLKSLGITTVELMPIHAFIDEHFLHERGLTNYWGYNSIGFFAPSSRYLGSGPIDECREMIDAIHDAGLELILDVVYNHTAEGNHLGPTLSFRGIDNSSYYRLMPGNASEYINDTGTGNTINADHPQVRRLILDSLCYWVEDMGVDGFRFDLAAVLGRTATGYHREHPFFLEIEKEPSLAGIKLIAEPWDVGPGGYQLGQFPPRWAEWNDRYRDGVRRLWRGDDGKLGEFANVYSASADRFDTSGRGPWASINFVASHDGFALADLVSYEHRHNEANGEENRDGHQHNYSHNYGVEGPTDDVSLQSLRRRQRLNMLATVLLSQGTPMLLAGDELGNSQAGNNNAYCQDNEIGWLDWSGLDADPAFLRQIRKLIRLRANLPLLRQRVHLHGRRRSAAGFHDIDWLGPDGKQLSPEQWQHIRAMTVLLCDTRSGSGADDVHAVAVLFNTVDDSVTMRLPRVGPSGRWFSVFSTVDGEQELLPEGGEFVLSGRSLACLIFAERLSRELQTLEATHHARPPPV
jgi:glycogen operon protein